MSKKKIARTKTPSKRAPKRAQKTSVQNRQAAARLQELSDDVTRNLARLVQHLKPAAPVGPFLDMTATACALRGVALYLDPKSERRVVAS